MDSNIYPNIIQTFIQTLPLETKIVIPTYPNRHGLIKNTSSSNYNPTQAQKMCHLYSSVLVGYFTYCTATKSSLKLTKSMILKSHENDTLTKLMIMYTYSTSCPCICDLNTQHTTCLEAVSIHSHTLTRRHHTHWYHL